MRRSNDRIVFIGIKGTVLALDRATGEELWRTPLKGRDFVNLALDGGDLLASARGELFCLDPASGTIRWNNPLTGLGWGLVTLAGSPNVAAAEEQRRREAADATTTSTATVT